MIMKFSEVPKSCDIKLNKHSSIDCCTTQLPLFATKYLTSRATVKRIICFAYHGNPDLPSIPYLQLSLQISSGA